MTICIAISRGSETWIASDGLELNGGMEIQSITSKKWHFVEPWWISDHGTAAAPLINHIMAGPGIPDQSAEAGTIEIAQRLMKACKEAGLDERDEGGGIKKRAILVHRSGDIWLWEGLGFMHRCEPDPRIGVTVVCEGAGDTVALSAIYCQLLLDRRASLRGVADTAVHVARQLSMHCDGESWLKEVGELAQCIHPECGRYPFAGSNYCEEHRATLPAD